MNAPRRKFLRPRVLVLLALIAAGTLALLYIPDPRERYDYSLLVLDRQERPIRLGATQSGAFRIWLPLEDYPRELVDALLFKEDRGYWWHPGFDPVAMARAGINAFSGTRSGASTLTMQLVRVCYGLKTDDVPGKIDQVFQAWRLSLFHSKRDLLELYLNVAPCGGNVEGFGTASWIWFGKRPAELNLAEIMALVSLPQNPGTRDPRTAAGRDALGRARDALWQDYRQARGLDESAGGLSFSFPVDARPLIPFRAGHFTEWCRTASPPGASVIRSSLDLDVQDSMEQAMGRYLDGVRSLGVVNAAAMVCSARTGEVLAYAGSADFFDDSIQGQVDGARALRSPGSTLKPFIYALALDQGIIHSNTVLEDVKSSFGAYRPDNFAEDFEGPVKAVDALNRSRNVPAVALARKLRSPDLYEFLQNSGAALPWQRGHYGLSLVLGGAETSMRHLVSLYGSLYTGGIPLSLSPFRVTAANASRERLISPEAAWIVLSMLADKERPGSVQNAAMVRKGGPVAYKTGTSIGFRDAWSVGVFDGCVVAVWLGNFDNRGNPEFAGARTAAPLMFGIVDSLRAGTAFRPYQDEVFPTRPPGVSSVEVCARSGAIPGEHCDERETALFIPGVSPIAVCEVHQLLHIDRQTGLRRAQAIPGQTDAVVYEVWPNAIARSFATSGLIVKAPPPLAPGDATLHDPPAGTAPSIVYPSDGIEYLVKSGDTIPCIANASSDARTLYWFVNGDFAGESRVGESYFWQPRYGPVELRVCDDFGRSSQVAFKVQATGN